MRNVRNFPFSLIFCPLNVFLFISLHLENIFAHFLKNTQNSPLREKKTSIIIIMIMMMIKNFVWKRVSLENFTLILSKHSEITTFKWKNRRNIQKYTQLKKKNSVYNAKNIQNQFCSISYSFLVPEKKKNIFL